MRRTLLMLCILTAPVVTLARWAATLAACHALCCPPVLALRCPIPFSFAAYSGPLYARTLGPPCGKEVALPEQGRSCADNLGGGQEQYGRALAPPLPAWLDVTSVSTHPVVLRYVVLCPWIDGANFSRYTPSIAHTRKALSLRLRVRC